ncbi:MAG: hypothetical protein K1X75_08485 [Leptospirales bacterium]|nr:hypothetical protein [Leptospirales bacterium]
MAASTSLLIQALLPVDLAARRPAVEEYPAPFTPYGLAYDGGNFWYSDIRAQQIVRIPLAGSNAQPQRVSMGDRRLYGMAFNPWDGSLYLGVENGALRISPLSGGIDARLRLPVSRVAGIAFGPDLWYLLEKGKGIIHLYDPQLQRTISQLHTGRPELRDITYYRESLWATDAERDLVLRLSPGDGALTGSLVTPASGPRGLTFADGQLWVVFRGTNTLQRVSFAEQRYFILSGEERYRIRVRLRFQSPESGVQGRIIVLQPPNTSNQQVSGVRAITPGWENRDFTASGERVFEMRRRTTGAVEFEYEFNAAVRNIRYLIPPDFRPEAEALRNGPAYYYYDGTESAFNDPGVFERLRLQAGAATEPSIRQAGAAARWQRLLELGPRGAAQTPRQVNTVEAYLPGLGWLPINRSDASSEGRVYERNARVIELFRQPDLLAEGQSAAFIVSEGTVSGSRKMIALPATVSAIPVSR